MRKWIFAVFAYTIVAILAVPAAVTFFYTSAHDSPVEKSAEKNIIFGLGDGEQMKVYHPETEEIVETPFEEYIKGVVGAEMPALFEDEALKAQAVAARTYAYRQMKENQNLEDPSQAPYEIGQAYLTKEELKEKWGNHFDQYYQKVSDAVDATAGQIMIYEEEPILAVFHSTSAGKTETAANVWGQDLPYLQSVDSIEDEKAPGFETETVMSQSQAIGRLQAKYPDLTLTEGNFLQQVQIVERTEAGYISRIQIGNKMITGKEAREVLGLKSSNFSIRQEGENLIFVTKGYGHGAGMSQYGANFMAKEGASFDEILKHYYQGVEIIKK